VKVYVGKKVAKTVKLNAFKKGKAKVTVPKKFAKGKSIKVKAKYVPTKSSAAKSKNSKTITVKRR